MAMAPPTLDNLADDSVDLHAADLQLEELGVWQPSADSPTTHATHLPYQLKSLDDFGTDGGHDLAREAMRLDVEFATTELTAEQCRQLAAGAVLPLTEPTSTEVRLRVANRLVAIGATMIVDGKLAVQITKLFGEQFAAISHISGDVTRTT